MLVSHFWCLDWSFTSKYNWLAHIYSWRGEKISFWVAPHRKMSLDRFESQKLVLNTAQNDPRGEMEVCSLSFFLFSFTFYISHNWPWCFYLKTMSLVMLLYCFLILSNYVMKFSSHSTSLTCKYKYVQAQGEMLEWLGWDVLLFTSVGCHIEEGWDL